MGCFSSSEAERRAGELIGDAVGGLDPGTRATRTIKEYAPLFLRHHQVEGNTKDRYADTLRLHVIPFLGSYRLAETDRTVARNYVTALQEEGRSANTIRQAKVVMCAMFGMAVADGYVDYNPFHDVKIPRVPGRRAIKVATPEQYLTVRACLPTRPAQVFSTLLVSSGIRFCEAVGLQPADFDFDACILEVARSVVKVSRKHHPLGKTFLVRDYTKNGQTRRLKLDQAVVELVRGHVAEHGIGEREVMFPADLVVPLRRTKPRLADEELRALGDCASGKTVQIRDPQTGEQLVFRAAHKGDVWAMCPVTVTGQSLLASGGSDDTIRIWNPQTGERLTLLQGHQGAVRAMCTVTVTGQPLLACGGKNGTIKIWDPQTGEHLGILDGHQDTVRGVCPVIFADRELLASASIDRTVRIWDLGLMMSQLIVPTHHSALSAAWTGDSLAIGLAAGILVIEPALLSYQ